MNAKGLFVGSLLLIGASLAAATSLEDGFSEVPMENRPWCYWWWINGHADKETITADLEAMKRLGFGGLLMFDSRGYWDDERHVVNPKAEIEFMSPEWRELVVFAINEAARLGLKFTMNMSSSGGKLDGPWAVGEDAPKRLVYRFLPVDSKVENSSLPYYHEIAVQDVWYIGEQVRPGEWLNGGDGIFTMEASSGKRLDGADSRIRTLVDKDTPGARCIKVRFGYTVLPDHEHDVDVLDPKAVTGHYMRFQGELQKQVPGLVGRDKTLAALYSVSWEGTMPTWTVGFEEQFKKLSGFDIIPCLPYLAGFTSSTNELAEGSTLPRIDRDTFMRVYRRVRNDMFRENFYGTMRDLSHERNIDWYSESGGPWQRGPALFREADQLEYLGVNDFPQGEFWPALRANRANTAGRYHTRAAVAAAHIYGRRLAAAEAFTHMHLHWSVDPSFLKQVGDQAYADGINHFVWHTFTCSPKKFGMPGAEYFAGSHINRNVTWHKGLHGFVGYLGRCQWLLQQGLPVEDYAVYAGDRPYQHWGRYHDKPYDSSKTRLPRGYPWDLVNDAALLTRAEAKGGRIVFPDGLSYGALVVDPEFPEDPIPEKTQAKIDSFRAAGVPVIRGDELEGRSPVPGLKPDFEAPASFTAAHRRIAADDVDIYFVVGEGECDAIFRVSGRKAQLWDAVTGERFRAESSPTADGRIKVKLNLPKEGSVFVVFSPKFGNKSDAVNAVTRTKPIKTVTGPWLVRFHNAAPTAEFQPSICTMIGLTDWAESSDDAIKYFSGTAEYATTITLTAEEAAAANCISIGRVPSGLAFVKVNDQLTQLLWCEPWELKTKFEAGVNTIRISVINNWYNRLLGDCFLHTEDRITTSTLRYWDEPRKTDPERPWSTDPTVYSGYSISDKPQSSGLLGPVEVKGSR